MDDRVTDDELNQVADRVVGQLARALRANVPEADLPSEGRLAVANEFLDFLGRLVAATEGQSPTAARRAAILYFTQVLCPDSQEVPDAEARVILTLVEDMKRIAKLAVEERARKNAS